MKAVLVLLALLLLLTGPPVVSGPTGLSEHWLDSRMVDVTMHSAATGGDETTRLLLPPDWSRAATRTWPVLYLLHGTADNYAAWTDHTDVESLTAHTEAIIVMPNAGSCGNYSNWWNQGRGGAPAWETFHLTELREVLESRYHAGTRRAIAGVSMGGFGAMSYSARNPGMFQAAAAYSGAVDPLTYPKATESMWLICPNLNAYNLWGDPTSPDEMAIWQQHDPVDLAEHLRGMALFMSSGDGRAANDHVEQVVRAESQVLYDRLRGLGIPVTTHFYANGRHAWPYWQREFHRSLPMLLAAIGAAD